MKKIIQTIVIGVIRKGNKYLLTKRIHNDKRFHGKWQFPGGGLEFNENIEECLVREIKEELGIEIKKYTFMPKIFEVVRKDWHGLLAVFLCEAPSDNINIVIDGEASEYGWFALDQIKKLDCLSLTYEVVKEAVGRS